MGDTWLDPGTCGVKLAEFERMTQQMTQAGPKLAELADELWQVLNGANVSTAPAMEIKRIAAWADRAASDLRRRNQLAHQLDRQKLAFIVCRPDGNYLKLPDRYTDQVAYAAGRRSADLFRRAAAGDKAAQAALRRLRPDDITPMFAKGLLESLGPKDLLKLPMDLTLPLAADVRQHRDGVDAQAAETRAILALLGRSLALATRPDTRAYLGDDWLHQLTVAGRTNFPPLSTPPNGNSGYQALSTLLTAAGETRFSTAFISVVGRDMIVYDNQLRKRLSEEPLPDLAGRSGLGNALDPTTTKVKPDERKTDFLAPLLTAAAISGKEASQILLTYRPQHPMEKGREPAFTGTTLEYLLHDRRPVWAATDHGAALGKTLQTAATGQDEESTRLAFAAGKILADDARKYFSVSGSQHLQIKDSEGLDDLSGLRPAMAEVLASHIASVNATFKAAGFGLKTDSSPLSDSDLDYLLLYVTRNADAFTTLLNAQIAHAKIAVDRAIADGSSHLDNVIVGEGWMFGHLLEIRNQNIAAEGGRLVGVNEDLRNKVEFGVALLPTGESKVGQTPVVGKAYAWVVDRLRKNMVDWITKQLAEKPMPSVVAPTTDVEALEKLFNQMVVSSLIAHGTYPKSNLNGQPFVVKGTDSKIMPIQEMNPRQLDAFIRWANDNSDLNLTRNDMVSSVANGAREAAGHFRGDDGTNVQPTSQR